MYSGRVTSTDEVGCNTLLDVNEVVREGEDWNTCWDVDKDVGVLLKIWSWPSPIYLLSE